jgi:hypothetical protein
MYQLAVDKGVSSYITPLPISDAKKAVDAAKKNELKGKCRFVLVLVGRHTNLTS